MGREQELLESARSGNVSNIEKLLNPRKKLTVGSIPLSLGPFPSLRRTPNPNCQDQNGDTPLHLAALNGHIEAVKTLLKHDGSANVMDTKGCYPLHLAAWSGNAEMCNVLLSHGPSLAKVNEQNFCGETALHCAAQYGHTATVAVLLPHLADPLIRNAASETPLDLASQYGRLDAVELLVRKCPGLLADHTEALSPLHLASRNGHRAVVQLLVDAGYDVNTTTESGTALHEASIFGKQEVVRLLLRKGVNANLTDSESRTVLEVLSEHRSQLSLDIGRIILDYLEGRSISDKRSSTQSASSDLLDHSCDRPLYESDAVIGADRRPSESDVLIGADRRTSSRSSGDSSCFLGATGGRLSSASESYFLYDTPKSRPIPAGLEEVDAVSEASGSPASVTGGLSSLSSLTPSIAICNSGSVSSRSPQGTPPTATPDTPKKPPRRKAPSQVLGSKARGPSPPRMVFINKRPSRDSSVMENPDGKNPNDNNNAAAENNNSVAMTTGENDNEVMCDNKCSLADYDDVTNSNHQTTVTSETKRDCEMVTSMIEEEVTSSVETTTLGCGVNNNNEATSENIASRLSAVVIDDEDDESNGGTLTASGNHGEDTRSALCRDSVELARARAARGEGAVRSKVISKCDFELRSTVVESDFDLEERSTDNDLKLKEGSRSSDHEVILKEGSKLADSDVTVREVSRSSDNDVIQIEGSRTSVNDVILREGSRSSKNSDEGVEGSKGQLRSSECRLGSVQVVQGSSGALRLSEIDAESNGQITLV